MAYIAWKGFKSNFKNFITFFLSIIMTVNILFLLMYIREAVSKVKGVDTSVLAYQYKSSLPKTMASIIPAVMVAAIAVIVYSVRFYVQSRMKDYGMLSVLGIKKRDMRNIIVIEYSIICVSSCFLGLLVGTVLSNALGKIMENIIGQSFVNSISMIRVYGMAVLLCIVTIIGVLIATSIMIEEKGALNLVKSSAVKEKRLTSKNTLICLAAGLLLIMLSILIAIIRPVLQTIALIFVCAGVFVGVAFGIGYLLERFRNSDKYCEKILMWDNFYHYFNKNKTRIIIQSILGIVVIYFTFSIIIGTLYSRPMPNDFACITEQKEKFLVEFEDRFDGSVQEFPFVWVNQDGGESWIGVSVTDYNNTFGKKENLEKDEIISVERIDGEPIGNYTGADVAEHLYSGSCTNTSLDYTTKYDEKYKIKKEEVEELVGFSFIGLVVLSDETFKEIIERENFHQNFMILNVPSQALSEATDFMQEQKENGVLLEAFCRETIEDIDLKENVLNRMIVSVVGESILFFGIFIVWLMIYSELEQKKQKFEFLRIAGMQRKEMAKALKVETTRTTKISMLLSVALSCGFLWALLSSRARSTNIEYGYSISTDITVLLIIVGLYTFMQVLFVIISSRWIQKQVLKEIQ